MAEARSGGVPILEIYATEAAYAAAPLVAEVEASGTPVYIVDDRAARKISDLETPTGIVAVTPLRLRPLAELDARAGVAAGRSQRPGQRGHASAVG